MKKSLWFSLLLVLCALVAFPQQFTGREAKKRIPGADVIRVKTPNRIPDYIHLNPQACFPQDQLVNWLHQNLTIPADFSIIKMRTLPDDKGETHDRYRQSYQSVPVWDANFIVHQKNGKVYSMNGDLYSTITVGNQVLFTESEALEAALISYPSERYKWEIAGEEAMLKHITGNADATYFPKGQLLLFPVKSGETTVHRYAYLFNIYSDKPLKRAEVYVDAQTGELLFENNLIQDADVPGTAATRYSGEREIVADQFDPSFRLRETGRGQGIETYNLATGTDYGAAVDFTDTDNYWNNINPQMDEVATDAHWGAEMTYDYYNIKYSRNSIDGQGFKLVSFVHYDYQYANAFWDGERMTYGDGDADWTPLTALDICGHEITHGLTSFTANLIYQNESGALSEGYSDLFGTAIEHFARPDNANWEVGEDIGSAIRSLSDPGLYGNPDTYLGNNWATGGNDNGGVHTNCGVLGYWFYLVSVGGSGTNDNGDAYNVTGIGIDNAAKVAFRTLTAHLNQNSGYDDVRYYSILSTIELFGGCSPEVEAVTNALYAVGLGSAYTPDVVAAFDASATTFCTVPAEVYFTNNSVNGVNYIWDFGDGWSSSDLAPTHFYTAEGTFTVSLSVDGGPCGTDSIIKTDLIIVNPPDAPIVTSQDNNCTGPMSFTLTAYAGDSVKWFTTPAGGTAFFTGQVYTTPVLTQTAHYYVENQIIQPALYGGKPDNSGGGNNYNNWASHYLVFDALEDVTIKSVKVYAQGAGDRVIELRNSTGAVIQTANINIPNGESRIDLNFDVPQGNDYQLAGPINPDLFRNDNGCNYPYLIGSVVSINYSSATQDPTGYYYFFYDWEVQPASCISERKEISAFVNSGVPDAAFTYNGFALSVPFVNTTLDGNTYNWDFGDGTTSTLDNPVHEYAAPGQYPVKLVAYNTCGQDSTTHLVNVAIVGIDESAHNNNMVLSPVPVNDRLQVTYEGSPLQNAGINIYDILGKRVKHNALGETYGKWSQTIDVSNLNEGVYILEISHSSGNINKRFIVQ
ncbi:MAG: M4 family metallopeptidase [Bacteroidetes bacterium]|nr:M4 family metallopeptidase [Bacteroidota bacterium]